MTAPTWNGKRLTAAEAADALATQVVAAARRAAQHQLDQGRTPKLDGPLLILEVVSEAAGGHLGEYLRRCTEATTVRTITTHVRQLTR